MLIDRSIATIGTANFDNWSFRLNFEITAVIAEAAFAAEVERMFEEDLARSRVWPLASSTGSRGGSDSARASPD